MAICLEKRFSWRPGFVRWLNQAEFYLISWCWTYAKDKEFPLSDLGEVTLKGFDHAVRVYQVNWTES